MAPRRNKSIERKLAAERIAKLFEAAYEMYNTDASLSNRYVLLARKIAMRYRIKIPGQYKRSYCRKCYSFFAQGKNTRTRITRGKVTVTCLDCGYIRRYPIKERK